ncbi:hypothetical protein LTR53_010176 [Teratosphaeriaceae sp. CCFEE 6253]|nr:hypothetical protein LTR53_010176 [Teratosphaeriaceae sp. CCFEE 6253]
MSAKAAKVQCTSSRRSYAQTASHGQSAMLSGEERQLLRSMLRMLSLCGTARRTLQSENSM